MQRPTVLNECLLLHTMHHASQQTWAHKPKYKHTHTYTVEWLLLLISGPVSVNGNTVLGSSSGSQTLTVNAVASFNASVTANSNLTVTGLATFQGEL